MTYMHIDVVNFSDLTTERMNWLEVHQGEGFVLITDGDESLQRDFQPEVLTLERVLEDISENEVIVFAEEAPFLEEFELGTSYWGETKLTKRS